MHKEDARYQTEIQFCSRYIYKTKLTDHLSQQIRILQYANICKKLFIMRCMFIMKTEFTNLEWVEMQYIDFLGIVINSIKYITLFILRLCLNSSVYNKHKYMIILFYHMYSHMYLFTLHLNCSTAEYFVLQYFNSVSLLPYLF